MGHDDGIEGVGHRAVDRDDREEKAHVGGRKDGEAQPGDRGNGCHCGQHVAAVEAVGKLARRDLHDRAREDRDRHQGGDSAAGQAGLGREDRAERSKGTVCDADQQNADEGDRRIPVDHRQVNANLREGRGARCGRQCGRQQRQAIENASHHEEGRCRDVPQRDAHLARDDRDIGDRHVKRED